jgi:hypothetical protein
MFNIRKNYRKNTLIIPNENYFIERAEKINDERSKKWIHATCAACDQFFEYLLLGQKDKTNLFYTRAGELDQITVRRLFKVLVVFYLYLYCKDNECSDEFRKNIFDTFEIKYEQLKNITFYKINDDTRDTLDDSDLPQKFREYLRDAKVSFSSMVHFYGLLLEEGFKEDVNKRPEDMSMIIKATVTAVAYFDDLVVKNI